MRNRLSHMAKGIITRNGVDYQLDENGEVDVPDEVAEVLLQNPQAWSAVATDGTDLSGGPKEQEKPKIELIVEEAPKAEEANEPEETVFADWSTPGDDLDEDVDEETKDIPDPSEEMTVEQLRELADMYEVKYITSIIARAIIRGLRLIISIFIIYTPFLFIIFN